MINLNFSGKILILLSLAFKFENVSALELVDMGQNWVRLSYDFHDYESRFGTEKSGFWQSGLEEAIRNSCMIETPVLPLFSDGEIDVTVKYKVNSYLFAADQNELSARALFGVKIEDIANHAVYGDVIAPGASSDWKVSLHAGADSSGLSLFHVKTLDVVNYRVKSPVKIEKDHQYRIGICPVLEMTDVGIEKIIVDIRYGL